MKMKDKRLHYSWQMVLAVVTLCVGVWIGATIMQQHPVIRDVVAPIELTQVTTDTVRVNDTLAVFATAYLSIDSIPDVKVGFWAENYYERRYISENNLDELAVRHYYEYVIQKMIYKIDSIKTETLCYVLKECK